MTFELKNEVKSKYTKKQRKRKRIKEFIQEYKSIPCKDCNIYKENQMTFDHIFRQSKKFNLSDGPAKTWKQVKQEILKCDVVCRPCHTERENKRNNLGCKMNREKRRNCTSYSLRFSMINELACELNTCKFSMEVY